MMTEGVWLRIDVAYARPGEQIVLSVRVQEDAQVADAIRVSGILASHPEIDLTTARVGVFGQVAQLDTPLRDRDRVEIYRPLVADAKEARRERAKERKAARRGSGAR